MFLVSVLPGTFHSVRTLPRNLDKQLLPGHAIKELILEVNGTLVTILNSMVVHLLGAH